MNQKNNIRKPPKYKKKSRIKLSEYWHTPHWRKIRDGYLEDENCTCQICGRRRWELYKIGKNKGKRKKKPLFRFAVHHKHYRSLYKEQEKDLLILCNFCHALMHDLEKARNISPEVYELPYLDIKRKTGWEYEKREK